jgi:hypothetical protein
MYALCFGVFYFRTSTMMVSKKSTHKVAVEYYWVAPLVVCVCVCVCSRSVMTLSGLCYLLNCLPTHLISQLSHAARLLPFPLAARFTWAFVIWTIDHLGVSLDIALIYFFLPSLSHPLPRLAHKQTSSRQSPHFVALTNLFLPQPPAPLCCWLFHALITRCDAIGPAVCLQPLSFCSLSTNVQHCFLAFKGKFFIDAEPEFF